MVSEVSAIEVRQHHLAAALRRRRDGAVLHAGIERAEQRHDLDARHPEPARRENSACGGFRPRPAGTPAPSRHRRAARSAIASAICRSTGASGLAAEIAGLDRKGAAFALDHRRIAEQLCRPARRRASPTSPECADPRASRSARRAPAPSPRSASSERSWNSSNSTAATPVSSGSSRIWREKIPSVTTSIRVAREILSRSGRDSRRSRRRARPASAPSARRWRAPRSAAAPA